MWVSGPDLSHAGAGGQAGECCSGDLHGRMRVGGSRTWLLGLAGALALALMPAGARAPVVHPEGVADQVVQAHADILPEAPRDCLEPVPAQVGVAGITDPGQTVPLDVLVLLAGVEQAAAEQIMAEGAQAYLPLRITLRFSFQPVSFTAVDVEILINQAREFFGGRRPAGVEAVYVITTWELLLRGIPVAGAADCVGGVRYPEYGFAAGTTVYGTDRAAGTAAHEVGHILGGQHHLGNCVEGLLARPRPCTIMWIPDLNPSIRSLRFSTPNGAIVRGHSVAYAT